MIKALISSILMTAVMGSVFGPGYTKGYDPERFMLPQEAEVLVVAECNNDDSTCVVDAYEKKDGKWRTVFNVKGNIGRSGMSKDREEGDGSTPVGVWMLNTPFGQAPAEEGFPENYIQVNDGSYVWTEETNKLETDIEGKVKGERVGTSEYALFYDYVLDSGYNTNAVNGKGSAIFIHCQGTTDEPSSGCVKIPKKNMQELMKLYAGHGDGKCFIALGIAGETDKLYDKYGTNNGLEAVY